MVLLFLVRLVKSILSEKVSYASVLRATLVKIVFTERSCMSDFIFCGGKYSSVLAIQYFIT